MTIDELTNLLADGIRVTVAFADGDVVRGRTGLFRTRELLYDARDGRDGIIYVTRITPMFAAREILVECIEV